MIRTFLTVCICAICLMACQNSDQQTSEEAQANEEHVHETSTTEDSGKKPLSPHTEAMANIGSTHVHIDYSSPGVRGRVIWGGLVAYDQVWVAGAHNATWVEFYGDVEVEGKPIPKGKYALFVIPGKETWTVILNENNNQHLADDYDQSLDVARFEVTPEKTEALQESLTWSVVPGEGNTGEIAFAWEFIRFSLSVTT